MTGTLLNVAGILVGGVAGLFREKSLSPTTEAFARTGLGTFAVFYGLRLTWLSLNGPVMTILKQLLVAVLALMAGKLIGRLFHLQQMSNRLGRSAREQITAAGAAGGGDPWLGFNTCAALFCAAPLGILGAVQDGLTEYYAPLGVKAVMDGLAAMGFVRLFGWGTLLSALPVLTVQGTLTLACDGYLRPFLATHSLIDPVNATGGLLVFSVGLVIFELKKIELTDYLPALAVAPVIAWLWR
jgi:hypothetical protein